ncbi:16S rRNA (cytidine(1402)-2'-O)-methyltransferase [bacterium]|nr:16S rRNA (cytidine(1402)-2'-O)-methyltransferase [bacterium]
MTYRAVEVLKSCDLILAEDTRQTGKLLKHYEIGTRMMAFHMNNEHRVVEHVIEELEHKTMAICSDAGTPGISDPGFLLVRACVEQGIKVEALPGATAIIPAIVASGLPCDSFVFEGFLPHKKGKQTAIQKIENETRTVIYYESPHRILKTLKMMQELLGEDRKVVLARELSKKFEEYLRGTTTELVAHFEEHPAKGEMVLMVGGVNIE